MSRRLRGEPKSFWRAVLWYMGSGPQRQAAFDRAREAVLREVIADDLEPHNPCHDRVRKRLEAKLRASVEGES